MEIKQINNDYSVSEQITVSDVDALVQNNVKSVICNRPDNEVEGQPAFKDIQETFDTLGIEVQYLPVVHDTISEQDVVAFEILLNGLPAPVHAYCRSGLRSITLWSLMQIKNGHPIEEVVNAATAAGFDFSQFESKFATVIAALQEGVLGSKHRKFYDVVIVGGGSAGIATASSLLKRDPFLEIVIIDPAVDHYYQPGFTMVGGGIFNVAQTRRGMSTVIPKNVSWVNKAVTSFEPELDAVVLDDSSRFYYQQLVVCSGLKLDWDGIEGLEDTIGKNGVTSNYLPQYAPYTWQLVQEMKEGKAIFTQPPMPIKCAGAPQKAMYLSADYWHKHGLLNGKINVEFCNAGPVLFGVKEYVPALMSYVEKYQATLSFSHKLVKVDGPNKTAWFEVADESGNKDVVEKKFNMLHVCPPQSAPDFIKNSPLSDDAGWVDVDQSTMQHKRFKNVWSLGDVANSPNAKTAAAARVQAPIVANNLLAELKKSGYQALYNGYGSCPLTVERGKIVLAEFGYGGKLLPSFPKFFLNGTKPSWFAWLLKARLLPTVYWHLMLKGREWLVAPKKPQ